MSKIKFNNSSINDYHISSLYRTVSPLSLSTGDKFLEICGNAKNDNEYCCNICNFKCKYKSNYEQHLLTEKHKKKSIIVAEGNPEGNPEEIKHICCNCNKEYMNNSGLWKHKKKCIPFDKKETNEIQNVFTPTNVISQSYNITPDIFFEVLHLFSLKPPIL